MPTDKILDGAVFSRAETADAFPLGGRVSKLAVPADTPASLDGVVSGAASLFMLDVPAGHVLFVGHRDQLVGKAGDAARDAMFPLREGTWTAAVTDAGQAVLRLLGDVGFTLRILAAATVDGSA